MTALGKGEGTPAKSVRRRCTRRRGHFAVILGLALFACFTASAAAVIVHLPGGSLSYLPAHGSKALSAKSSKAPVSYHGGPVMSSNSNYTIYWSPTGAAAYPAGYEAGVNRYLEDLAHDSGGLQNTDSLLVQYGNGGGEFANYNSQFAGALSDTDPYPANGCSAAVICMTDQQIRNEVSGFVESHKLPTDLQHEYFLLTPAGVESCLQANEKSCSDGTTHPAFCAYHGFIPVSTGVIVYANAPYVAGLACNPGEQLPNENPSDAEVAGGLAHEHSESVTDPELNAWYDIKGEEVADKCRTGKTKTEFGEPLGKAPDGADYNQLINGDLYWFQQEWSNEIAGCSQRFAQLPVVAKLAPKKGPAPGGTTVTITGSGFVAPAVVRFGEAQATGVLVTSANTITASSPAHAAATVDVTVTTGSGTSAITKKDHYKYK
jgi:IPT/TIG domain